MVSFVAGSGVVVIRLVTGLATAAAHVLLLGRLGLGVAALRAATGLAARRLLPPLLLLSGWSDWV